MPRQPTSMDIIFHDLLDSFTDREAILNLFEQSLGTIQPGQLRVLAIKGNSGTGKTFLISYLTRRVCPRLNWQSGQLSFAQSTPDFRSILMGIEDALKDCVPRESLKRYREKRDEYNRRFDEYRASIIITLNVEASDQSSISNVGQSVQVNAQLRERELHLRSELTRALIELSEESTSPLCLFIDGYERLTEGDLELDGWLWEELLLELAKASPQPLLVVTCGWERPANAAIKPFSYSAELGDFDLAQVRSYLEKQEVITGMAEPTPAGQDELTSTFYELTKGHPLVLGLAVTYFKQLDSHEHTAQSLRANRPLVDEQARVEFLEDRLLKRLPEPYRTLLERGPVLRHFDQAALQALLNVETEGAATTVSKLDDRTYDRFLRYPFINQGSASGSAPALTQPTFHDLVRRVRLEALRRHHPGTKEKLHRKMAEYYREIVEAEREQEKARIESLFKDANGDGSSKPDYAEWLAEIPEKEFRAQLEYLYHALQVKELQGSAFEVWRKLIGQVGRAVSGWRHQQEELLLELVKQLVEEDEPFIRKANFPYGQYLFWYAHFLTQEARWEEAQAMLGQAVEIFKEIRDYAMVVVCYSNAGYICQQQGQLEGALSYFMQTLSLSEQADISVGIAQACNNIGSIYQQQGKLEQALSYFERALALCRQEGNPANIATCLTNIGGIYQKRGELEQALNYFKQALAYDEQVGNPINIAASLHNIGSIYQLPGSLDQALNYYERALELKKRVGNSADIAISLNNIGGVYKMLGDLDHALEYFEQSLAINKQIGSPGDIALSFNNIGGIYSSLGKLGQALRCYERTFALYEQVGMLNNMADTLHNIGMIYEKQGKLSQAIGWYRKALCLFESLGYGFEVWVANELERLATCYLLLGELEKSVSFNIRANRIRDEIKKIR
jgi:tetratricopeptide (TPR) repeat protein